MSVRRFDYFMFALEITYLKGGEPKQRRMNTIAKLPKPTITYNDINQMRLATLARLREENAVEADAVKDFVILGSIHLGRMTEAEFQDREEKPLVDLRKLS